MGFLSDNSINMKIEHNKNLSVMKNTHIHSQYEIYFCPEHISQISVINGVKYSYKYPCVILSTPYTVHSMSCGEDAKSYDRYVFYFQDEMINTFNEHLLPKHVFEGNTGLLFKLTDDEAQELLKIVVLCNNNSEIVEKELIFTLFINRLLNICPQERIEKVGTPSFYIQKILKYISENFSRGIDGEEISRHFSVSRSKLDRDFKNFTGRTVHDYVELCRINHAKYMLEHSRDMSVREIALSCGFENESYFFPFFKKLEGVTPTEYRKALRVKK